MPDLGRLFISVPHLGRWYIYSIHDAVTNRCLYVGYAKLAEIATLQAVRGNPALELDKVYEVRILAHRDNVQEALRETSRQISIVYGEGTPSLNMTSRYNRYANVKCNQTGEVFQNASAAARALQIPQGHLSAHLARKPGHKSIKGLTFEYVHFKDLESERVERGYYSANADVLVTK